MRKGRLHLASSRMQTTEFRGVGTLGNENRKKAPVYGGLFSVFRLSKLAWLISFPALFMKSDIHPENYRPVVFKDTTSGFSFLSKSCARTTQTVQWEDGNEYPLVILGISSASHPFYTGQQMFVDTAGRVDKFQQRLAKTKEAREKAAAFKKRKR